jgi:hypothetical protein
MKNPWMKFYPSDWRADPALRSCSIAARGLWIEMLAIMHDAEPYGSLLVNGQRIDKKRLAALAGVPERDCSTLLLELEVVGVFSRDEDGTIYSRRMRRDAIRSEEGRRQIAKRWGNSSDDRDPNRSDDRSPTERPITQKPEARSQKETRASALSPGWPSDYRDQFWNAFPNKVGKPMALKKLDGIARGSTRWEDLMAGLDRYIRTKPSDRAWLNPGTFLNQERWADQPASVIQLRRVPDV